ncbi:hypothetical protein J7399_17235 [Shimia sp. R9_1]|uniref:hypothetical protein n=1 Tax=Shimia sp. R9_1 TaxID=2821111 RepID=UPI001ADCDC41|nr:hypothetical protein [Shimia sp. R9_1]MBO9409184.1 hypothetical protein [Shimia sp. R9_1]
MRAPPIGVASNFGVDQQDRVLRLAQAFPILNMRDSISWKELERAAGAYDFGRPRTGFPAQFDLEKVATTLIVHPANPLYEAGNTVMTEHGIAAFARYVEAVATAYPGVVAIEVANEFNGGSFIKGPARKLGPMARADLHAAHLAAVSERLRARAPEVRIIGGAAHSIPAGYLWRLLDQGAAAWMDAIALHPYTTEPEQFVRQVAVLRRHPEMAGLGIDVTEFGHIDREGAPGYMLRYYCQMALAGVDRVAWYPLVRRGKYAGLFARDGSIEPAGRSYRMIAAELSGTDVEAVDAGAFTYGCAFDGGRKLVLWGASRPVTVTAADVTVRGADAVAVPARKEMALSREAPLVFSAERPLALDTDIRLGAQALLADSFDQFAYPSEGDAPGRAPGFQRFLQVAGAEERPFVTRPGQEARGRPWTPYLGTDLAEGVRLTARGMQLGGGRAQDIGIVHRYVSGQDVTLDVSAKLEITGQGGDGVMVVIKASGGVLVQQVVQTEEEIALTGVKLPAGQAVDIVVRANGSSRGNSLRHRFQLFDAEVARN